MYLHTIIHRCSNFKSHKKKKKRENQKDEDIKSNISPQVEYSNNNKIEIIWVLTPWIVSKLKQIKKQTKTHCLKHHLVYTTISLPKMHFSALIFQLP